jgi:uncharacterized repeat protein (TIGR04076 family)
MIRREFCKTLPCYALALGTGNSLCREEDGARKEAAMTEAVEAVKVKVLSIKGTCGLQQLGDTALITRNGVEGKICIHALYSLLPAAFAMLFDVKFPWLQNPDVKTHACPDAANPVVFEISKVRG